MYDQGKNIGPMLINYIEKEAFKRVRKTILEVIPLHQENLVKFYKHLGYKTTDQIIPFPEKDKLRFIRPECRDHLTMMTMEKSKPNQLIDFFKKTRR